MIPADLDLADHYRGDAWDGFSIGPIKDENGNNLPSICVSARIHFRDPKKLTLGYALSTNPGPSEGTITIVNAETYEFLLPRQVIDLDTGTWVYDFETIDALGFPTTWIKGSILVLQDRTYD